MKTIERKRYLDELIAKKENGSVKIITGIRRCGKSFLLFEIYYNYLLSIGVDEEHIITLALDDDANREYRDPDKLSAFLHGKITDKENMYYILLDEVQFAISESEMKSNEPIRLYGILNGLLRHRNVDIYVTGSNSKFLSSDVLTEFRGRGDEVRVNPLSFAEFYSVCDGDKYEAFDEYATFGGLPMVLSRKTENEKSKYLTDLLKNLYIKDVIERNKLQGDVIMDSIVDILASSVGSLTNPPKLANTFTSNKLKTNANTVAAYIEHLTNAFLLSRAERYDVKGKKYISSPYKYYFTDIGIRNAKLNFRQQEQTHIMENIIYNELVMRGYNVDVGVVDYFGSDKNGKRKLIHSEVDFVCNVGNQRYYIQSAFSIPDEEKMKQEQASLDHIGDSFKKIIIVKDHCKAWRNDKGYLIMNVLDFLLDPNSLDR
ncbi:MAG: ATP-binding protein [Clostridia bacterium]|nr:ATP-binding protein [Clostridia bacterium]